MKIRIWSSSEFLVHIRAPPKPRSQEICLCATNSPTAEAASFCQLQGGFVPPGLWSSSSRCSQGHPAAQPGSSAGRALQAGPGSSPLPSTPRCAGNQSHHSSAKHLSGVVFFRPPPLSSGLLLNLIWYYSKKNKNSSSVLNVYLRSKIVIKINQLGALKQISLILYQAGKKLAKKTPLI